MLSTCVPVEALAPRNAPFATWTTLTTTAAMPGHFTRLRADRSRRHACRSTAARGTCVALARSCWSRSGRTRRLAEADRMRGGRSGRRDRALPCASCVEHRAASRGRLSPASTEILLPPERRVPHEGIEAGVLPLEHLRELDLPVERRERLARRAAALRASRGSARRRRSRPRSRTRSASPHAPSASRPRRTPPRRGRRTAVPCSSSNCASSHRSRSSQSGTLSSASRICWRSSATFATCSRTRSPRSPPGSAVHRLPVEGLDLLPRQPDQRVAVPQRVVEEGERVVLRQRHQPERQLGEVHRHRVPVHAVEAALGDEPAREDHLVLVRRDLGPLAVGVPGLDEASPSWRQASTRNAPEPIAGSQTLRSRICSGRGGRSSCAAQPLQDRLERRADDRLGQRPRRVVRARAAALLARLQDHRAAGTRSGVAAWAITGSERRVQVLERRGRRDGRLRPCR